MQHEQVQGNAARPPPSLHHGPSLRRGAICASSRLGRAAAYPGFGIALAALLAVGTAAFAIHQPHVVPGGPAPPFNAFIQNLDLLIPLGPSGLRAAYAPAHAAQWLAVTLIAAGWILATAVIAGITRAIRRD